MPRYAKRATATPLTINGRPKCARCGREVDPWPLRRPDNCGPFARVCIRQIGTVIQEWRDAGFMIFDIRHPRHVGARFL